MIRSVLTALGVSLLCASSALAGAISYPPTRTVEQVDVRHGVSVSDPYRWLEQDVRVSPEVAAWVEAQNGVTRAYLDTLPGRAKIEARLKALWDFDRFGIPTPEGGRYFFRAQSGLQNQAPLFVQEGLTGEPRLLLDPNTWAQDGATALAEYAPSPDGKLLAYSVQDGGSDWRTIRVLNVDTGEHLGDEIKWVKFSSIEWAPDGKSLFYARYPEPPAGEKYTALNYNQAVYRHVIGQKQADDQLVYSRPQEPTHGFGFEVTDDGKTLVINVWKGTDEKYEIVLVDLTGRGAEPQLLISGFENDYTFIAQDRRGRLLFRTDLDAPRGRIIAIDPRRPDRANWRNVVPQGQSVLTGADRVGDVLLASYLADAKTEIRRFGLDGRALGTVALPGVGTASGFSGKAGDPETFYSFTSFNQPPTIYRYDARTGASTVFRQPKAPFDPNSIAVSQVFYTSKDGTRVPMFLVHRKDVTPNGARPTLLWGYGGFNISVTPGFSVGRLQWVEMGGVLAIANIRGGGEYGKDWHDGGRLLKKQNVFDDFIAAAEHLIASGWTSAKHIGIQGGSNGGLLVGAVVNQRPDLFAVALPAVGVMDMLRYDQFSAGRFWVDDYGSPDDPAQFKNLLAYSPLHNVKDGVAKPAILVTTADTDDRVVPGHSFKYTARIQAAQGGSAADGDRPRLIRIETRAGHGSGKPTDKIIAETADLWAFLAHHTGLKVE